MSENNLKPMQEIMKDLSKEGFTHNFRGIDNTHITLNEKKGSEFTPDEVSIVKEYRFEGDSNPDDMSILYALETKTGIKGVLVNGYGISADPELDEFLLAANKKIISS